jgi:methylenetetrahydrofolate reductase (NADPH)
LIIGGDPDYPVGPFPDSVDFLASGLIERYGLREVAFAGYPEGHPGIAARGLDETLRAKVASARRRGLEVSLVTQFGFDAAPILRWIEGLRAQHVICPVRVGIAGPATVATLAKFAVRCGIGGSLRALARGHTAFARILAEAGPDALVDALVDGEDRDFPIDGLHVFTFGGVRRTAAWIRSTTTAQ